MGAPSIIELVRPYVLELFSTKLPDGICYHNTKNTQDVV